MPVFGFLGLNCQISFLGGFFYESNISLGLDIYPMRDILGMSQEEILQGTGYGFSAKIPLKGVQIKKLSSMIMLSQRFYIEEANTQTETGLWLVITAQ
jgi:hypothetical protein